MKDGKNNINCPICENDNVKCKFQLPNYSIFYCITCELEFNADFPPKNSVTESFSEYYYTELQKEAFTDQKNDYTQDPSYAFYRKGLQTIEKLTNGRKVLDVGAGVGAFLKTAHESGWKVEGVEISRYGSEFIKKNYGFNVYSENLTLLELDNESYDVITFWDSIEHMELPKKQLMKAFQLMKTNGILILTSDNYRSLMSFLCRAIYFLSFQKISYPIERFFIPYNKTYFTHNNMRDLLTEIGYDIILFEKMQYPLNKIKLGLLEKLVLKVIYILESFLNVESQFTFIARKPVKL